MEKHTDIVILTVKDLQSLYGFNRDEVYVLLKTEGCPVLPRERHAPYKVIQDEFEKWLRGRRVS